ncbi:IS66 family insertion sequence element accessory protein TnpA [Sorangium sp. So ce375]|uniref:IS66 family insertion sequence element accessory protein TnpA n=1 Tax=Sorangium sp. So ce375 TaxID=3133306 RepID=UPI003F5B115C
MMACMTRTKATEVMWSERVRAWRESGQTAEEFARSRGFAASTLHGWSSRLSRTEQPRFLRLVPKAPAVTSSASELVVEVGGARACAWQQASTPRCWPTWSAPSAEVRDDPGRRAGVRRAGAGGHALRLRAALGADSRACGV